MTFLKVSIEDDVMEKIRSGASLAGISEEKFITDILSRYVVESHIMESKDVEEGYAECGDINLELAK